MATKRHVAEDVAMVGSIQGNTSGTSKIGDSTHRYAEVNIATGGFIDYAVTLQFKKAGVNSIKIESDKRISGVTDPSGAQDVATKAYVDAQVGAENLWDRNIGSGFIFPHTLTDKTGLGTNTPSYILDVVGDARFNNDLYISGSIHNNSIWLVEDNPPTTFGMRIWADGDTLKMYQRGETSNLYQYEYNKFQIPGALYLSTGLSSQYLYFGSGTTTFIKGESANKIIRIGTNSGDKIILGDTDIKFIPASMGFFNTTPVSKTSVSDQSAWASINSGAQLVDMADLNTKVQAIRDKLQEAIDALQSYGLI